jgi:hypothetical protein
VYVYIGVIRSVALQAIFFLHEKTCHEKILGRNPATKKPARKNLLRKSPGKKSCPEKTPAKNLLRKKPGEKSCPKTPDLKNPQQKNLQKKPAEKNRTPENCGKMSHQSPDLAQKPPDVTFPARFCQP